MKKIFTVTALIIFKIMFVLPLVASANEIGSNNFFKNIKTRVGIWDYKHDTDAYAINFIHMSPDNTINVKYLGLLQRVNELSLFVDVNNGFSSLGESNNGWRSELSFYASSGLAKKISLTNNLSFVPSFSLGLYQNFEEGKDMGFPLEFKSEAALQYNLFKNSEVGISLNHISNADIGSKNPGSDNLLFGFRIREKF